MRDPMDRLSFSFVVGGRWGNLVAAAVSGAKRNRVVWIDIFAGEAA